MKYLVLVLSLISASVFAMEPKAIPTRQPACEPVMKYVATTMAASIAAKAAAPTACVYVPSATGYLWALLIPSAPTVATAAAVGVTAYGAYKGGEYLYNRYTKPANSNQ
jgi:hypothetical protein